MKKTIIQKQIKDIMSQYPITSDKDINFKILTEIAQLRKGKIKNGETYVNGKTKMIFLDEFKREFSMTPREIKLGKWSPYYSGHVYNNPDYHMKQLVEIALSKGGRIKEGETYINAITKMTFIDQFGNEFKMSPNAVKSGSWSTYESGKVNDPHFHMQKLEKIVLSKGGKIKEGEIYINNTTKMIFIDKLGREFSMSPRNIKSDRWSPYESGNVYNNPEFHMKELEEIVLSKGGKIKEGQKYLGSHTKMLFIDRLGNEFKMAPTSIKGNRWSPYEVDKVRESEYHMKKLEQIALSRGGRIKEGSEYINSKTKMTFIDQFENEFDIIPSSVKLGYWSPYERNYSENICRQIIEQLYNKKFPSSWDIIKRKGKRTLQLDGYNENLQIAFEYQGEQHFFGWFNVDKDIQQNELIKIQERDAEKKQICIDKNILLLEINYYKNISNVQDIINQTINDVKKSYEKNNLQIPQFIINIFPQNIKIDFTKISHLLLKQKEIEEIVLSKGGKIKEDEVYINSTTKITLIDKLGNEFRITPANLKTGYWSTYESGRVNDPKYHMKEIEKIVLSKGGKIKEGSEYINSKINMTFIDKLGNEFDMNPTSIKKGSWSPYESGYFREPEYHQKEIEKIVLSKGGKIKEGCKYINTKTKMTFIDKLGNEFTVLPSCIKRGQWSPYESGHVCNDPEYYLKKLREMAIAEGYEIKKDEIYINAKTKITLIDKLGNEFEISPNNFQNGRRPKLLRPKALSN